MGNNIRTEGLQESCKEKGSCRPGLCLFCSRSFYPKVSRDHVTDGLTHFTDIQHVYVDNNSAI